MDDLKAKIEELLKGLFSLKEQQGPFVPTLKPQKVAGPSASAAKPAGTQSLSSVKALPTEIKPTKVAAPKPIAGGMAPSSKKDPAKVAEQLKNPRPKKTETEVLKVESNGQWSLS